jgi:tetratricopeptide (TPR) repeat protein
MFYTALLLEEGYTLDRQNHAREGVQMTQRAITLMDTTGRAQTTANALARHDLGVTYNRLGETARAEGILRDVLSRLSHLDTSGRYPNQPLIHYAHAAMYQGDADSARKYFALLADEGVGDHNTYWEGRALFGKAEAEIMLGRLADARASIARLRQIANNPDLRKSDDQVVNVNTLDALMAMRAGDTAKADALLQQVLTKYGYYKGRRSNVLHSTLMLAAQTALAMHRPDSALVYARDARTTATRDSLTETRSARVGEARVLEARAEFQQGDTAAARADLERALVALRNGAGETNVRTRAAEALAAKVR